jgi:hypothetical protein
MTCQKCASEVRVGIKFCNRCGEPVEVQTGLRLDAPPASKTTVIVAAVESGLSVETAKSTVATSPEPYKRSAPPPPSTTWPAPTREKVSTWAVEHYSTHYEILDADESLTDQELNNRILVLEKRIEQWATHPSDSQLQALGQEGQKRLLDLKKALADRASYRETLKVEIHTRAVEKIRKKVWDSVKDDRVLQWDEWQPLLRAAVDEGVSRPELEEIIFALKQQGILTGVMVAGQEARTVLELRNFCNGRSHHLVEIMWNGDLERWLNLACVKPELAESASALKVQYSQSKELGAQVWLWVVGEKRIIFSGPGGEEEVGNVQQWVDGISSKRLLNASVEALEDGRLEKWFHVALDRPELIEIVTKAKGKGLDGLAKVVDAIRGSGSAHEAVRPFKFGKFAAYSVVDLIQLCEAQPDDGQRLLFDGRFERWIDGVLGEAKLAEETARVTKANQHDQRKGLEHFVRLLCENAEINPYPLLVAHPNIVEMGAIPMGASIWASVTLENVGRGYAWGEIALEQEMPGVTVPVSFDGLNRVDIALDSVHVVPGTYQGDLIIHASGVPEPCRVPIRFEVLALAVTINPLAIDIGQVPHGKSREISVRVNSAPTGGRMLGRARITSPASGLRVTKSVDGESCELRVMLDTSALEAGRRYKTSMAIDLNAGAFQIPIEFQTQLRWDIVAMWTAGISIGTGLLMLLSRYALAAGGYALRGGEGRLSTWLYYGDHQDTDVLVPCGAIAAVALAIIAVIIISRRRKKKVSLPGETKPTSMDEAPNDYSWDER